MVNNVEPIIDEVLLNKNEQSGINRVGPVIVNFKHASCNPKDFCANKPKVDMTVTEWKSDGSPVLDMSIQTSTHNYVSSDADADRYFRTFLAICNKKTGKTKLVECRQVLLQPEIEPPKSTNKVLNESQAETKSWFESNKDLVKAFGQKKGQRYLEMTEKLRVDKDNMETTMIKAAQSVDVDSFTAMPHEIKTEGTCLVPPRDEGASSATDIYRLEHFLTDDEVDTLLPAVKDVLETFNNKGSMENAIKKKDLSNLGVFFLEPLLKREGEPSRNDALILYLEGIVRFVRLFNKEVAKGPNALQRFLPTSIKSKIFQLFSGGTEGRRVSTPELKDKAICHAIAIALNLAKCKLDLSLITQSVRIDQNKIKKLIAIVGATVDVAAGTSDHVVVLRKTLATFDVNQTNMRKRKR